MERSSYSHIIFSIVLLIVTINLFVIDLKLFSPVSSMKLSDIAAVTTPVPAANQSSAMCPAGCITMFNNAFSQAATLSGRIGEGFIEQTITNSSQKENFIPLGTGTTAKDTWDDIVASETQINPDNYGTIKEAYFIASLRNPTKNGIVEAQIYNVTDGHPVWGSHIVLNGPDAQTIQSDKIALASGNKLYRVQLKTSMSYQVYLDSAKIRIISE